MELRQLRYFIAVAERLSFREAADAMCISQPPLTRQIQQLESELQCTLLRRSTRTVALTVEGEQYLRHFREIVGKLDETADDIARIGLNKSTTWRLWVPWFADFSNLDEINRLIAQATPYESVTVQPKPALSVSRALLLGKVDCVIVDADTRNTRLKARSLGVVPYGVATAANPPNLRKRGEWNQWISEVGPLHTVSSTTDTLVHRFVDGLNHQGVPIPDIVRHNDTAGLMHSLATGRGFALLPTAFRRTGPKRVKFFQLPGDLAINLPYFALSRASDVDAQLTALLPGLRAMIGAVEQE